MTINKCGCVKYMVIVIVTWMCEIYGNSNSNVDV